MARSAKRAEIKAPAPFGALGGARAAVGAFIAGNPALVGGSVAFMVTLSFVSGNALWNQQQRHPGVWFATRGPAVAAAPATPRTEPQTTILIERPKPAQAAPTPADQPKPDPVVRQVQQALKDLKVYSGPVDGVAGPNTRKAVEAYRARAGMKASGEIDAALLARLGAADTTAAIVPAPTPRASVETAARPVAGVTAADDHSRVMKIQAGLKAFGNDGIEVDGVVGARTKAALREFQSIFGLPETGEPDPAVHAKMKEIGLTN